MIIHIEDLEFECIIGLLDFEREVSQRVIINLELLYDYKEQDFINYADVAILIEKTLKNEKYVLLEDALGGLHSLLVILYPQTLRLFIKISKPDILKNCKVSLSKTWNF